MFEVSNIGKSTLLYSPTAGIHSASLGVFVKVGARAEPGYLKGIAHFLEHMLFKGSTNYSHKKIKQEIEGRGGMVNAFTSQEVTAYYTRFLDKNIFKTLDIFIDMIANPLLLNKEINKERKVIFEEIKMHRDLPHIYVTSLLEKLLWQNHSLGKDVAGKFEAVSKINKKDLSNFHRKFYTPENIIFSYVGRSSKKKIIDKILHKVSSRHKNRDKIRYGAPRLLSGPKIHVEQKEVSQTHVCLGFPTKKIIGLNYLKIKLLHVILGANMSSRLFEQAREKNGFCYDIATDIYRFQDSGAFSVQSALTYAKIQPLLKVIFKELYKIKSKKVPQTELRRAKDYLLGQTTIANEQPLGRMLYMAGAFRHYNKIYDQDYLYHYIESVTSEQIRQTSEDIFNFNRLCIAAVSANKKYVTDRIKKVLSKLNDI